MSTNPFRRSSLKGPSGSGAGLESPSVSSASLDTADADTITPPALSVNTKVGGTTQKHVNFASPPAIPISPVSYPPSPESTRFSPRNSITTPVSSAPTDYSVAIQSYPFRAEAEPDEDDGAIEQALENAKTNTTLVAPHAEVSKQDAIKNTLSRFASAPKRPAISSHSPEVPQPTVPQRQTMDVDAFKRLLLTGNSNNGRGQDEPTHSAAPLASFVMNDNSSATDTASISQRSLFDHGPPTDESPRSSTEIDAVDVESLRQSIAQSDTAGGRNKPPPPAPRHGKPIKDEAATQPQPDIPSKASTTASSTVKQPPTPPLARRRSQNTTPFPSSSRKTSSGELEQPTGLAESSPRAPPPPRPRRPVTATERRPSSELPTTLEEPDLADSYPSSSRRTSDSRPTPPPARNSFKRVSASNTSHPPVPPPRRGRGLSKSSVDSQGSPLNSTTNVSNPELDIGETSYGDADPRKAHSSSNTHDIMAEIAALQREVEEARRKVSR